MDSKPLGFAILAIGVMGAAGLGSYLALRPSQATSTPAAISAPAAQTQPGATAASAQKPVAETEGAVAQDSKASASAPSASGSTRAAAQPVEAPRQTADATSSSGSSASKKTSRTDPAAGSRRSSPAPAAGRSASPVTMTARRDEGSGPGSGSGQYYPPAPNGPGGVRPQDNPNGPNGPGAPGAELPRTADTAPPPPQDPPEPPKPRFEDLVLPADSVIGLRIQSTISSESARIEDRVEASVTRDVRVNGEVAIPAGSRVRGNVTLVDPGGKFKERARLGVRFHTLVLADGSTVPIQTETVYREGEEMANKSAAKIGGGAAAGALIGAIFGGGKGAAIGAAAGGAAGTGATMAGPRSHATLPAGSTVTVRLSNPATVTIEK
jgi:hypothetical protein